MVFNKYKCPRCDYKQYTKGTMNYYCKNCGKSVEIGKLKVLDTVTRKVDTYIKQKAKPKPRKKRCKGVVHEGLRDERKCCNYVLPKNVYCSMHLKKKYKEKLIKKFESG